MSFSSRMQAVASSLLEKYGESTTITVTTNGNYTPDSLGNTRTTNSYTCYGHPSVYKSDELIGDLVKHTDVKLLVYTTNIPVIDDTVTLNSTDYRVMDVQEIRAQGNTIVYILQLRA